MNKADLVNEVAKAATTKKDAQAAVDSVLAAVSEAMKRGDAVSSVGFGTFKAAES